MTVRQPLDYAPSAYRGWSIRESAGAFSIEGPMGQIIPAESINDAYRVIDHIEDGSDDGALTGAGVVAVAGFLAMLIGAFALGAWVF